MAVISLVSLRKLQTKASPLYSKGIGIFANTQIMFLYGLALIGTALGAWMQFVFEFNVESTSYRILIVQNVGFILQMTGGFLLDMLILFTYLRYSRRIDENFASKAINILTESQRVSGLM